MTKHRKEAWLVDDDVILPGYKDKYGFHPDRGIQCGFDCQKRRKKDKDVIYFMSLEKALSINNSANRVIISAEPVTSRGCCLSSLIWQKITKQHNA